MSTEGTAVGNNDVQVTSDHEWNYYTLYRIPVIINNNDGKSNIHEREIGKVFAEYKDNLVVIDGENKKEQPFSLSDPARRDLSTLHSTLP